MSRKRQRTEPPPDRTPKLPDRLIALIMSFSSRYIRAKWHATVCKQWHRASKMPTAWCPFYPIRVPGWPINIAELSTATTVTITVVSFAKDTIHALNLTAPLPRVRDLMIAGPLESDVLGQSLIDSICKAFKATTSLELSGSTSKYFLPNQLGAFDKLKRLRIGWDGYESASGHSGVKELVVHLKRAEFKRFQSDVCMREYPSVKRFDLFMPRRTPRDLIINRFIALPWLQLTHFMADGAKSIQLEGVAEYLPNLQQIILVCDGFDLRQILHLKGLKQLRWLVVRPFLKCAPDQQQQHECERCNWRLTLQTRENIQQAIVNFEQQMPTVASITKYLPKGGKK